MDELETFYRKVLRIVQVLSENVASEVIYLPIGSIPVKRILHLKFLSMSSSITRLELSNPLHQVAVQQMSIVAGLSVPKTSVPYTK